MRYARPYNPIISFLIRLGIPLGPQALLAVRGRKTGRLRTTPVALNPTKDGWLLVSVYGRVDWVRNLQASGEAVITMRRQSIPITSRELDADQAAPLIRDLVSELGPVVRSVIGRYFVASPDADMAAWQEEARRHPSFLLMPSVSPQAGVVGHQGHKGP